MSVSMTLLAILEVGPSYGLQLKHDFETRTGGIWPLNVGQVYSTLQRLQRDGLVDVTHSDGTEGQKIYELTPLGLEHLERWFQQPSSVGPPARDESVLKLVMATRRDKRQASMAIQAERRAALEALQDLTRLKREEPSADELGWSLLLDSVIFNAEARVRWLEACETRIARAEGRGRARSSRATPIPNQKEIDQEVS